MTMTRSRPRKLAFQLFHFYIYYNFLLQKSEFQIFQLSFFFFCSYNCVNVLSY
uniref:Uncharacterized protein n=1 Tax=Ascaris lumbricoides TaxID=6252 RepID=A0A0M3HK83_ASCLU